MIPGMDLLPSWVSVDLWPSTVTVGYHCLMPVSGELPTWCPASDTSLHLTGLAQSEALRFGISRID
jgi:hypothetical protein